MASSRLTAPPRAVLFDVYNTLMDVGQAPADAEDRWRRLFEEFLGAPPPYDRETFTERARRVVAQHHAGARASGIEWPEVLWPAIVAEIFPGLLRLPPDALADFIFRQMQISRSIRLADGAAECLRRFRGEGTVLGIASNAQAYTLRELDECLQTAGLERSLFDPALCFWSFEHGFSKPDPHVFRILTARLGSRGIPPAAALMAGDRLDNDILPALAHGWQVWQRRPPSSAGEYDGGDFRQLLDRFARCR